MNSQNNVMNEAIKELIAIGASVGAHCQPCLEYHLRTAIDLGISEDDIRAAIAVGHTVEKGAMSAMNKFSAQTIENLLSALHPLKKDASEIVLKIYDPAMCCSSGVCGPSVDPVIAQFASTIKSLEEQTGIRVERYNLSQQPQAFVENDIVKSMLGNGGEQELPFIFINDQLWIKGRYPSKTELAERLQINEKPDLVLSATQPENTCCSSDGCC